MDALTDIFDTLHQHLVFEQHQVHIEQGAQFLRGIFGRQLLHAGLQPHDFLNHRVATLAHPVNFGGNLVWFDEIVRHITPAGPDQHSTAHHDAARYR